MYERAGQSYVTGMFLKQWHKHVMECTGCCERAINSRSFISSMSSNPIIKRFHRSQGFLCLKQIENAFKMQKKGKSDYSLNSKRSYSSVQKEDDFAIFSVTMG